MSGPLDGLKVLELGAIGPSAHAAMFLGDLGAEVVRVDRPDAASNPEIRLTGQVLRNRRSVTLDLKDVEDLERFLQLAQNADVLIEGFRPGVAEKLGLGPDECFGRNPRLVFARITGWGRTGPLARFAGHDLNYLAVSGVLSSLGSAEHPPPPPLNLVADYGGGSMFVLVGILAALWERNTSGRGQVVDAAMLNGVSVLSELIWSLRAQGSWDERRGVNLLDGAAPFYTTYRCQDDRYLAVAPLEAKFYEFFLANLGLDPDNLPDRDDPANWPELHTRFADVIVTRSRDDWASVFAETDSCVSPVLTWSEAAVHPQMVHQGALYSSADGISASPGPWFSRSELSAPVSPRRLDQDYESVLADWGLAASGEGVNDWNGRQGLGSERAKGMGSRGGERKDGVAAG